MTKRQAKATLVQCFRALTKRQRSNLLYHAKNKTKILCGEDANRWAYAEAG